MSNQPADREGASRVRSVRMYDDAWTQIGTRSRDRSPFIRDMTDAGLQGARCYRCFELVPVEFADLTGKPLAEWVAEAQKTVTRQHRDGHHPVTVGAEPAAAATAPDSARTVRFVEPKQAARS
jgi:hypothetical protein